MANGNSKALEKENAARMQIRKERAIRSNFLVKVYVLWLSKLWTFSTFDNDGRFHAIFSEV